jgi:hypothetical protein
VTLNVTFTRISKSRVTLIYKKQGDRSYTNEIIELSENENYTFSITKERLDQTSPDLFYIVATATSSDNPRLTFKTVK